MIAVKFFAGEKGLPSTCPPLPEMPAHKLNAVSGVGRRVASSGEADGRHRFANNICRLATPVKYGGSPVE
jgi:hypothetical protein